MIKQMKLSLEERAVEILLDDAGLLHDVDKEHFRGKEDVIVICCPDGRQFLRGILNPFVEMYDEAHKLCLLPLTEFGGTLILDNDSPLVVPGSTIADDFIRKIKYAVDEMGYKASCPINHQPCSGARRHKVHPLCVVDSLAYAKERIKKKEGVGITVANFFQITDIEQDRRRLSRVPYNDYVRWRGHHGDAKLYGEIQRIIRSMERHRLVNNELQNLPNIIGGVI